MMSGHSLKQTHDKLQKAGRRPEDRIVNVIIAEEPPLQPIKLRGALQSGELSVCSSPRLEVASQAQLLRLTTA